MLAAPHRLRTGTEFRSVMRGRGSGRAGSRLLVVHATVADTAPADAPPGGARPSRVGFIVSTKVGNAVVRNRTKRVLRHQMAARLSALPGGTEVVVRANPAAALRGSSELGAELDRLLPAACAAARRRRS